MAILGASAVPGNPIGRIVTRGMRVLFVVFVDGGRVFDVVGVEHRWVVAGVEKFHQVGNE